MEKLLQEVIGVTLMSISDGFFTCNQISVVEENRHKTSFIKTLWTYYYAQMLFGVNNSGATFQWVVDCTFRQMIGIIMEYYRHDLNLYYRLRTSHWDHLQHFFEICA